MSTFVIGKNKILAVKSSDRVFGTPSNFAVNISQYNLNPTYCSFHQVAIPNGFYNVSALSNLISVTVYDSTGGVWPVIASIAPGNYTGSNSTSVLTAAQNALNQALAASNSSAPGAFFSVTCNPLTGYVTISCSQAGWSFTLNTLESLDWILGFRQGATNIANVTSTTSSVILDLRSPPTIYIRCSIVSGNYVHPGGSDSFLVAVQNTALFSQTIFQRSPSPELEIFPVSGQIGQMRFQLVDEYGNELNMDSNQEWEINIALFD